MGFYTVVGIVIIAFIVVAQGFFSGSEMALVSANRARLEDQANNGSRGATLALSLLEREDQLLGTCLIGTNISLISGATLASGLVLAGGGSELVATLLFAPFALLLGEAVPKTVYQHHATTLAPILAYPLRGAQIVFKPLLVVVGAWAAVLRRLVGDAPGPSREELVMLLDADQGSDIDPEERDIIMRVLEMNETAIEEAMTPLVEICAVSEDATVAEAADRVLKHGHSRLLVYRDRIDNIIGMVTHHELLFDSVGSDTLVHLVKPVRFVPESKRADQLLEEMRSSEEDLVVVVDEYGGVVGLATLEDLLEEMVGEILDERDTDEPGVRRLSEREWRIPARTEIDDVTDAVGYPLPEGEYETLAGLILDHAGRIPSPGDVVKVGRLLFLIEQGNERAIHLVRMTLPPDWKEESG
ncbi:MAG: HlyC/CorC family transporter [Alphaproteobacteria bacterium]|nr:HlyC/CorC family transporter [Alphaproteobacteria bacterium]